MYKNLLNLTAAALAVGIFAPSAHACIDQYEYFSVVSPMHPENSSTKNVVVGDVLKLAKGDKVLDGEGSAADILDKLGNQDGAVYYLVVKKGIVKIQREVADASTFLRFLAKLPERPRELDGCQDHRGEADRK